MAFLLPPLGRRDPRDTLFDRARQRNCSPAYFGESPARFNSNVDMHAARAAGLRPTAQSHLLEKALHFKRNTANVGPTDTGARIKIHPQRVRMLHVSRAHGM